MKKRHASSVPTSPLSSDGAEFFFARNPLPMWIYDRTTLAFIAVNEATIEQYGYPRDEILSMRITDILAVDDPARHHALMEQLGHRIGMGGDWRHQRRDGSLIDVQVDFKAIDYEGRPAAIVVARDVTEQRAAERALRESESRYRDLFENANDIIYTHDLKGRFISANHAAEALTGYARDQLSEMTIDDVVLPEDLEVARAQVARKLAGDHQATTYELRIRAKDGRVLTLEVSSRLVFRDGEPVAIEGVARDITERKTSDAVIKRQTARAEAISDLSRALASAELDLPTIFDRVGLFASDLIGDACVIRLVPDDDSPFLHLAAVHHPNLEAVALIKQITVAAPQRVDEGLFAKVVAGGEPVRMVDFEQTEIPQRLRPFYESYRVRFGMRSVMSVPLKIDGRVCGSITLTRDADGEPYNLEDEDFAIVLADRTSAALANARLLAETQQQLRQVQALHRLETSIVHSGDMRVTLELVTEQIKTEIEADAVAIVLLQPLTQRLVLGGSSGFRGSERITSVQLGRGSAGRVALTRESIMISDLREEDDQGRAELAAREGFVGYAAVPLVARGQIKGVLEIFHRTPSAIGAGRLAFIEALASHAAVALDNAQLFEELQRANLAQALAYETTLEGWSRALDLRDHEIEGHSVRVAQMTYRLGVELAMSDDELLNMRRGALLHDIGKMGIPDAILQKAGPLSDEEWAIMRKHPEYAYELLSPIDFLRPVIDIPYYHHERWDGGGYPKGLRGDQIPIAARIFALIDVWDALRSDRPYRSALPEAEVRVYIDEQLGRHFDPRVGSTFLRMEWGER